MPLNFEIVAIAHVLPDEDFRISYHPEKQDLFGVREFGIIQPVLLFPHGSQFQMICGFRRLEAARGLGIGVMPAMICRGWERKQAVVASLLERLTQGPLNDVERARSVEKFSKAGWSKQELADHLFPLLEVKFNEVLLKELAAVLKLPLQIQERLARGEIYLYTAHRLWQWAPHALQIAQWFTTLKLGVNKQRELLDLMDDVARVCKVDKAALVRDLEQLCAGQEPARVYERWLQHLKGRRYPRLNEAQQRFEETRARFHLPGQIQLTPPPFFEENRYRISFPFSSREELERYSRKLVEIAGMPDLDEILELI